MRQNTLWAFLFAAPVALAFYLLPLISNDSAYSVAVLTVIVPAVAAVTSLLFGIRHGRELTVAAAIILMLSPSIFMYYDSSACVYIIAYGVLSVVFSRIGAGFHREK